MNEQRGPIERIKSRPVKYVAVAGLAMIAVSFAHIIILANGIQITWFNVRLPNSTVVIGSAIGALAGVITLELAALALAYNWFKPVNPPPPNPGALSNQTDPVGPI